MDILCNNFENKCKIKIISNSKLILQKCIIESYEAYKIYGPRSNKKKNILKKIIYLY